MKYMLLLYANQAEMPQISPTETPEAYQSFVRDWYAFESDAKAAGVYVTFTGLNPVSDATSVRVRDGKTLVSDGPFAETHEQLGGAYVFDCKDLDEAIAWAARIPGAQYGTIEVRPLNQWSQ
jgi:hypothetical protein